MSGKQNVIISYSHVCWFFHSSHAVGNSRHISVRKTGRSRSANQEGIIDLFGKTKKPRKYPFFLRYFKVALTRLEQERNLHNILLECGVSSTRWKETDCRYNQIRKMKKETMYLITNTQFHNFTMYISFLHNFIFRIQLQSYD